MKYVLSLLMFLGFAINLQAAAAAGEGSIFRLHVQTAKYQFPLEGTTVGQVAAKAREHFQSVYEALEATPRPVGITPQPPVGIILSNAGADPIELLLVGDVISRLKDNTPVDADQFIKDVFPGALFLIAKPHMIGAPAARRNVVRPTPSKVASLEEARAIVAAAAAAGAGGGAAAAGSGAAAPKG